MRAALISFALILSTTAYARDLELSAGSGVLEAGAASMDAVTDDDLIPMAAFRLAVGLPELGPVFAEVAWRVGTTEATNFGEIDARLQLQDLEAALRIERPIARRLRVFARAGGAITFGSLELTSASSVLDDDARTVTGLLGAGVDLTILQARALHLGLRAEVGIRASGDLAFHPTRDLGTDDARLRTQGPDLGAMDPSGTTAGVTLFARF